AGCPYQGRGAGGGSPAGLKGEGICLGARIFAVVDALDAIRSDRIYRPGRPFSVAREEIARHAGTQFDPQVVDVFLSLPEATWEVIRLRVERMAQEAARLDREDGLGDVGRFWQRREALRQTGK